MGFLKFVRVQWDRVAAGACVVVGAFALLAGWLGVSRHVLPAAQMPYVLSGGLAAILLVGVGATLWLSADLRDEWRHLDQLEKRLESRVEELVRQALADGK